MPGLKLIGTIVLGVVVVSIIALAESLRIGIVAFGTVVQVVSLVAQSFLGFLADMGTMVDGTIGLWNAIPGFFTDLWNSVIGIFQGAVNSVVNVFAWLYNHNTYFKDLMDSIQKYVQAGVSWLTTAWKNVTSFLSGIWTGIVKSANDLWTQISNIFSGAWNTYIAKPLTGVGKSISDFFGGLIKSAFDWGKNLIQGIINGINSMAGAAGQSAQGITQEIAHYLGFHSPTKKGPGIYADLWGPNLVNMFAAGVQGGQGAVANAARILAESAAAGLGVSEIAISKPRQSIISGIMPHTTYQHTLPMHHSTHQPLHGHHPSHHTGSQQPTASTGSSSGRSATFIFEVDGHEFAKLFIDDILALTDKKTRLKVSRGRAA